MFLQYLCRGLWVWINERMRKREREYTSAYACLLVRVHVCLCMSLCCAPISASHIRVYTWLRLLTSLAKETICKTNKRVAVKRIKHTLYSTIVACAPFLESSSSQLRLSGSSGSHQTQECNTENSHGAEVRVSPHL